MKPFSLFVLIAIGFIVNSDSFPTRQRMVYFQPSRMSWYAAPQRLMYMQYQHVHPSKTHTRSTQAAAALVAGDAVATGTYLKDCHNTEDVGTTSNDDFNENGAHIAQSVAEAYPDQNDFEVPSADDGAPYSFNQNSPNFDPAVENLIPNTSEDQHEQHNFVNKTPRDYNYEKGTGDATSKPETADIPISEDEAPTEISTNKPAKTVPRKHSTLLPSAPTILPSKRYLPAKKKVIVELEQENEEEQEGNEDEETSLDDYDSIPEDLPARVPNAKRPTTVSKPRPNKKPSKGKAPLPSGTFFPIDFGGTTGGAIAIANSFSTGEGGSATSHAVAYGSPEAARARLRPNKFH